MASAPPSPYTSANASADIRVSEFMNVDCSIAVRTPMSRTRPARTRNSRDSEPASPNSLISVAPGAENRSVIWVFIVALLAADSRDSRAIVAPIRRAGIRNSGISASDSSVICHEMLSITASVSVRVTRLVTTPDSVSENARCAPITSLPSRLTSAPVRVLVKNATGIRCTWSKTAVRRSRIRPSPIAEDSQRVTSDNAASATATAAMTNASLATTTELPAPVISSTTRPASSGVATVSTALDHAHRQEHRESAVMPSGEPPDPPEQACGPPASADRRYARASAGRGIAWQPFPNS